MSIFCIDQTHTPTPIFYPLRTTSSGSWSRRETEGRSTIYDRVGSLVFPKQNKTKQRKTLRHSRFFVPGLLQFSVVPQSSVPESSRAQCVARQYPVSEEPTPRRVLDHDISSLRVLHSGRLVDCTPSTDHLRIPCSLRSTVPGSSPDPTPSVDRTGPSRPELLSQSSTMDSHLQ